MFHSVINALWILWELERIFLIQDVTLSSLLKDCLSAAFGPLLRLFYKSLASQRLWHASDHMQRKPQSTVFLLFAVTPSWTHVLLIRCRRCLKVSELLGHHSWILLQSTVHVDKVSLLWLSSISFQVNDLVSSVHYLGDTTLWYCLFLKKNLYLRFRGGSVFPRFIFLQTESLFLVDWSISVNNFTIRKTFWMIRRIRVKTLKLCGRCLWNHLEATVQPKLSLFNQYIVCFKLNSHWHTLPGNQRHKTKP